MVLNDVLQKHAKYKKMSKIASSLIITSRGYSFYDSCHLSLRGYSLRTYCLVLSKSGSIYISI